MITDEQAIRDLVHNWHTATSHGDVEKVLTLMSEDVVFLVAGHAPMKGKETFEKGLRSLLTSYFVSSTHEIQEIGIEGNLAYCWTHLAVEVKPIHDGEPIRRAGNALSILRKNDQGNWVVVRDANLLTITP
jgi:uncharacterized protein (TIGR02246 family)